MSSDAIVSGEAYLALPRAPETWLVEGLLPVGGEMLLYGEAKVGKSFAALQLACSLATGREWLGFAVPVPVKVVYVQLDTPRGLWAERLEQLRENGWPIEACYFADRETLETHPFNVMNLDHFKLLSDALAAQKPDVVVFDTLKESHQNDENDATAMQVVISHLEAAVKPAGLILITHSRKHDPERGMDLKNDPRGSNYLVGKMDAICRFTHTSMRCVSRTLEEHSIPLERADDGTWGIVQDNFESIAAETVALNPGLSLRKLAQLLHERSDRSAAACRSYLSRRAQKLKHGNSKAAVRPAKQGIGTGAVK